MIRVTSLFTLVILMLSCCCGPTAPTDFTAEELALIQQKGIMRVLTIEDSLDLGVLRSTSSDMSKSALVSEDYTTLCSLMVATVTHPSQDGVGIAGPQVGLNRRVVAVQRFDKEGEPFEVYPNIRIVWASDSMEPGPEGCLSVPSRRGEVLRSQEIEIEYDVIEAGGEAGCSTECGTGVSASAKIRTVREKVSGFTAVIFQHEIDHLEGVLYIDRL